MAGASGRQGVARRPTRLPPVPLARTFPVFATTKLFFFVKPMTTLPKSATWRAITYGPPSLPSLPSLPLPLPSRAFLAPPPTPLAAPAAPESPASALPASASASASAPAVWMAWLPLARSFLSGVGVVRAWREPLAEGIGVGTAVGASVSGGGVSRVPRGRRGFFREEERGTDRGLGVTEMTARGEEGGSEWAGGGTRTAAHESARTGHALDRSELLVRATFGGSSRRHVPSEGIRGWQKPGSRVGLVRLHHPRRRVSVPTHPRPLSPGKSGYVAHLAVPVVPDPERILVIATLCLPWIAIALVEGRGSERVIEGLRFRLGRRTAAAKRQPRGGRDAGCDPRVKDPQTILMPELRRLLPRPVVAIGGENRRLSPLLGNHDHSPRGPSLLLFRPPSPLRPPPEVPVRRHEASTFRCLTYAKRFASMSVSNWIRVPVPGTEPAHPGPAPMPALEAPTPAARVRPPRPTPPSGVVEDRPSTLAGTADRPGALRRCCCWGTMDDFGVPLAPGPPTLAPRDLDPGGPGEASERRRLLDGADGEGSASLVATSWCGAVTPGPR